MLVYQRVSNLTASDAADPRNLQRATTGATNTPATTVRSTQASTAPAPVYAPVRLGRDVCGPPETWLLGFGNQMSCQIPVGRLLIFQMPFRSLLSNSTCRFSWRSVTGSPYGTPGRYQPLGMGLNKSSHRRKESSLMAIMAMMGLFLQVTMRWAICGLVYQKIYCTLWSLCLVAWGMWTNCPSFKTTIGSTSWSDLGYPRGPKIRTFAVPRSTALAVPIPKTTAYFPKSFANHVISQLQSTRKIHINTPQYRTQNE